MTEQEALYILGNSENISDVQVVLKVAITVLEEVQQYRAIGKVEECWVAVEKQRAKKPTEKIENEIGYYHCANCDKTLRTTIQFQKPNYCLNCGQYIDWSDEW